MTISKQKGDPSVSVVMPVFNSAATVARALDSVLAQTMKPLEIIAVDDASTDGTHEILDAYRDRGVIVHRADRNGGAGVARNRGAAVARGAYLAFIDADDRWHPRKLEQQLAGLVGAEASVQASCTGYRLVTPNRTEVIDYSDMPTEIDIGVLAGGCFVSPGSTLMVSRTCFEAVGAFDPAFRRYEDWDWLLRYSATHRLRLEREALATVFDDRLGHSAALAGLRRLARKHRSSGVFQTVAERLKFESHLMLECGAICHRAGKRIQAALWTAASLTVYPARYARIRAIANRALSDIK